ncbi:hypothetical protein B0H15DRAFT_949601 [Mycena belliarum]|uniref:Uncharacterized protein n=1 Tax=Mycena belliarum TaxID=1033014 RepID=A0AAD6XLY5_9AGAR|nr:hypothetical protein B0H15DRAFT_949601 [Mycena belliae]
MVTTQEPSASTQRATSIVLKQQITDAIIPKLSPEIREKLEALTRVADLLGIDDMSFASYSSAITRLSSRESDAQHTLNRLAYVEQELKNHLQAMRHEEQLIESWIERLDLDLKTSESASTIERRRELLLKKAKEDRAVLETIVVDPPPTTFADLTAQQAANERRAQSIKSKRAQIKAFRGLPPNLELARQQLKAARAAQMKLIQTRERLLGRMADGVA